MEYKYVAINRKDNTLLVVSDFLYVAYSRTLDTFYIRGFRPEDIRIDRVPETGTVFIKVIDSPDDYITIEQVPYYNR